MVTEDLKPAINAPNDLGRGPFAVGATVGATGDSV
jgi:hypothetical protein